MNRLYINKDWSTLKKLLALNAAKAGATPKTETLSGSIVTFSTTKAVPLIDCKAEINPVQDLHGYEHPWPAGGGVNILPSLPVRDVTRNGITFKSDGNGTYSLSGTASPSASIVINLDEPITYTAGTYYISVLNNAYSGLVGFYGVQTSSNAWDVVINANNKTQEITFATDTTITALSVYIGNGSTVNFTFSPVLSKTGFVQAFTPYSNICPITGWTGAKVTRTGKNLLKPFSKSSGIITQTDDGRININGTSASTQWLETAATGPEHAIALPPGTYTLSGGLSQSLQAYGFYSYDDFATRTEVAHDTGNGSTFTLTKSGKFYMQFQASAGTYNNQYVFPQLETGSILTSYEPYTGETVDVQFPTEAGTVYGGSLDVTNGVLTVDRAMETITKDGSWYNFNVGSGNASAVIQLNNYQNVKFVDGIHSYNGAISSVGIEMPNYWVSSRPNEISPDMCFAYSDNGQLRIHRTDVSKITDIASFKENLPDVQIVYPLATPITYQLTPQEITTLSGNNTMLADTGDITVTYRK